MYARPMSLLRVVPSVTPQERPLLKSKAADVTVGAGGAEGAVTRKALS